MAETASTREVAGQTLADLGAEFPDLVVLGGDLNVSTFAFLFGDKYPDRFFDFGPAEQNIVSVAAGMASSGKIPVVSTFAVFSTSRPHDQLRVGVSQPRLNVKVIATHSGIITGEDGVSAHSIEDLALMCALPEFTVVVPADGPEAVHAVRSAVATQGPFYVRLSRAATPVVHGEGVRLPTGRGRDDARGRRRRDSGLRHHGRRGAGCRRDACGRGHIVPRDQHGDGETAGRAGRGRRRAGDGRDSDGGGALRRSAAWAAWSSQTLAREAPTPQETVALHGYAESGPPDALMAKYHLTAADVAQAARRAVSRKAG